MKDILKKPAVNAACVSLFSAFYALVFVASARRGSFAALLYYTGAQGDYPFWRAWSGFLAAGRHAYIAYALIALTALIVIMLLLRRRPYDEYHTANLQQCLAAAAVFTLIAIAVFYLLILHDANGVLEKFTLFIVIHWASVVLADLAYVFICRWR